jgi:outer membrane lipoprotein-sorting protein
MKKLAVLVLALTGLVSVNAQTADEIINKYIDAMGGTEKLSSIKSIYMEGTSVMQNGAEIIQKIWKVDGKLMRREVSSSMFNMISVVTDKEGWSQNPRSNGNFEPMTAEMVTNMQSETDCAGPLVNYAAKGHKAELIGKEEVEGTECWKIKLTLQNGKEMTYYINPATFYIDRVVTTGGGFGGRGGGQGGAPRETKIDYSDYKKTEDGYLFPFKVTIVGMGGGLFFEKIEVNKPVDPKAFKPEVMQ